MADWLESPWLMADWLECPGMMADWLENPGMMADWLESFWMMAIQQVRPAWLNYTVPVSAGVCTLQYTTLHNSSNTVHHFI